MGDDIILDYNRDGKIDYKDQINEMIIIEEQEKDEQIPIYLNVHKKENNNLGCFTIIIIIIAFVVIYLN